MILELSLGSLVMLITISIGAMSAWVIEKLIGHAEDWLVLEPQRPKLFLSVLTATLGGVAVVTISVWIWAATFRLAGVFGEWEPSLYFALVAFTTLGYGDVILPQGWRILGGMTAANGMILFGLVTALIVDALRQVQKTQRAGRQRRH